MFNNYNDPWLFNKNEIEISTPSRIDGLTWEQERDLRREGCRFIRGVIDKMRKRYSNSNGSAEAVPESAASIFYQRFFTYESFKKHNRFIISTTCIFLGFKVEEHPRHIDTIMKAYCEMRSITNEEDYKRAREAILASERLVLNVLCFDLRLDHPISPCVLKLKIDLKSYIPQDQDKRVELVNNALSFLRDSSGSVLCILYPAKIIAMGAAFLSLLNSNLFPNDSSLSSSTSSITSNHSITAIARAWYELIKNDITIDELMDVCNQMLEVYILWSERDRRKSSTRETISAPDVSNFRSAIASLKETNHVELNNIDNNHNNINNINNINNNHKKNNSLNSYQNSNKYSRANDDKEEVNLDDPYPYEDVEDHQNNKYSSNSAPVISFDKKSIQSTITTTITTTSSLLSSSTTTRNITSLNNHNVGVEKPILKVVQPPPTPEFQPPSTPNFLPPQTPEFQPPSTPQFEPPPSPNHFNQSQILNKSDTTHPTPDFQPPPTPDFLPPPSTPEFLPPPSTPESFHFIPSSNMLKSTTTSNRSPKNNRNTNSHSSSSPILLNSTLSSSSSTSEYNNNNNANNNNLVPTKRPRFQ